MSSVCWLHLSDWHQKGPDFNRKVVRDRLLADIQSRAAIDPLLAALNFVIFSGDIAFHGHVSEYETAKKELFQPLIKVLGIEAHQIFFIPGNHDIDLQTVAEMLPPGLQTPFQQGDEVNRWLTDDRRRVRALEPFDAFRNFVSTYSGQSTPEYASCKTIIVDGMSIGLLGINSAWMCGRHRDVKGEIDDYGKLVIGEPQIHDAVANLVTHDLRISVVHHPFNWLSEFERGKIENAVIRGSHFILSGHQHVPAVQALTSTAGQCVFIPCGASYDRREPSEQRYANAFNFVTFNMETGNGTVYLRRWSNPQDGWIEDVDTHKGGKFDFSLPRNLVSNIASRTTLTHDTVSIAASQLRAASARYRKLLLESCDIIDLANLPEQDRHLAQRQLELRQLYVPLRVWVEAGASSQEVPEETWDFTDKGRQTGWGEGEQADEKKRDRMSVGQRLAVSKRLVILGDPGAGKTTLTRWIATAYLLRLKSEVEWKDLPDIQTLPQEDWLPILVRCRDLDAACLDGALDDVLKHTLRKAELSTAESKAVHELLLDRIQNGRALLILDGLDEITDPLDRSKFCSQLENIVTANADVPIIATSRIVGYRELGRRLSKGFEHLTIADLTPEEKDQFATRWCNLIERPERRAAAAIELQKDIHSSDRIERLTGNPMLLTTMALVKRKVGKLPQRRAELYGEAVHVLLNWRAEVDAPIDPYEALPQLEYLSYAMCDKGVKRLREGEVLSFLEQMRLEYRNVHPIYQRSSRDFLRSLERRTAILIETGRERYLGMEQPVYEFRHLTFQEYLAARAIVDGYYPNKGSSQNIAAQIAPLAGRTSDPNRGGVFEEARVVENWREALRLSTAICKSDDVDKILKAILSPQEDESPSTVRARAIQAALCLADEPNASDVVAREIVKELANQVRQDDGRSGGSGLAAVIVELCSTRWEPIVRNALLQEYYLRSPVERNGPGGILAIIEASKRPKGQVERVGWLVQIEARLRGSDERDASSAALSIMEAAFDGELDLSATLVEALFARLMGTPPMAHAAAWALGWLSEGGHMRKKDETKEAWLPNDVQAGRIVALLRSSALDVETARWLIVIAGSAKLLSAVEPIVTWLGRGDARLRANAVRALGSIGDDSGSEPILAGLRDQEQVQLSAIEALGELARDNREWAIDALIKALRDRGFKKRADIAREILNCKNNRGLQVLETMRKDENKRVREMAMAALARDLEGIDRKLLSRDFDGREPFIDPGSEIGRDRIESAARRLGENIDVVKARYDGLAQRFGLVMGDGENGKNNHRGGKRTRGHGVKKHPRQG
jgi:hypothetical protein